MHWWKCERKITMALFAKKKNEKDKKEFYQLFFFYHFSEKIQLSFLYPVYIRLLNILCVYFKIFYKILLPWLCKLTVIWVLNQSWKNLNLRSASCLIVICHTLNLAVSKAGTKEYRGIKRKRVLPLFSFISLNKTYTILYLF